jgi:hypothetical protein
MTFFLKQAGELLIIALTEEESQTTPFICTPVE